MKCPPIIFSTHGFIKLFVEILRVFSMMHVYRIMNVCAGVCLNVFVSVCVFVFTERRWHSDVSSADEIGDDRPTLLFVRT